MVPGHTDIITARRKESITDRERVHGTQSLLSSRRMSRHLIMNQLIVTVTLTHTPTDTSDIRFDSGSQWSQKRIALVVMTLVI